LIHWNVDEAAERVEQLRAAGYIVSYKPPNPAMLRELRRNPPAAVAIDLSRLPSHGRDVALAIRQSKATRRVLIVFIDGDPEKVARIEELLPDAIYTSWSRIRSALRRALARPPADPLVPSSILAGYSGTPLVKKLGIKANMVVALLEAPNGFEQLLGALPEGVKLRRQARGRCDLVVWFARSRRRLERRIERLGALAGKGGLWIAWPKRSSGVQSDLTQAIVRRVGLAAGLVDYKVCAIDATWSGLRFTRRRPL
jgi:CheY-like chemotaxis protein